MQRRDFLRKGLTLGTVGLSGVTASRLLGSPPVTEPALLYIDASYAYDLLVSAIEKGEIETVKSLIGQGADVNATNEYGWTLLHHAASEEKGNVEIVKLLVSNGADVHAKGRDGETPLHNAAFWNQNIAIPQFFVSQGVNVNAKDDKGNTPLHWAVTGGCSETVRFLVAHGANVNAKNKEGKTPLDTE